MVNYIVLDLEWNMCADGKYGGDSAMPFEIIEIGAVKIDEKLNIVSSFNRYVKPNLYKKIHNKVKDLVSIDMNKLNSAESFPNVVNQFLSWCGEDYIFCTWGSTDLFELQRNMHYYGIDNVFPKPFIYYDIQKFYSILHEDGKVRSTLETVVNALNIPTTLSFHNALNDAHYTALVCKKIDFYKAKQRFSIDYYVIPSNRREEIYAEYDTYEKFISKGYDSREAVTRDRVVLTSKCYICGKSLHRKTGWFSNQNHSMLYIGACDEHGYIKGRLKVRQTDSGKYFAIRIMKVTDTEGAEKIMEKQRELRRKRREKRIKSKQ